MLFNSHIQRYYRKKQVIFLAFSLLLLIPFQTQAISLGIVSDIHAGSTKLVSEGRKNWFYPNHYCANLEGVKKSGADYILALGDNTLNGRESEATGVIDCLKGYRVFWVKGNHDKEVAWKYFNTPNYYSKMIGNWKLIVLDSSKKYPGGSGGLFPEQLIWLEKELFDGENIIIAMHHHIFQHKELIPDFSLSSTILVGTRQFSETTLLYPEYQTLKSLLETSGKVKYVYSGHVHSRKGCKLINGISYCQIPALSLKNGEGYFSKLTLE